MNQAPYLEFEGTLDRAWVLEVQDRKDHKGLDNRFSMKSDICGPPPIYALSDTSRSWKPPRNYQDVKTMAVSPIGGRKSTGIHQTMQIPLEVIAEHRPNTLKLLSCPFYVHNPTRHRNCAGGALNTTSRLKEHLRRAHLAYRCTGCSYRSSHRSDVLIHHVSSHRRCGRQPNVKADGDIYNLDYELLEKVPDTGDTEQNWYAIWHILFPIEPRPATARLPQCSANEVGHTHDSIVAQGPDNLRRPVPLDPTDRNLQDAHGADGVIDNASSQINLDIFQSFRIDFGPSPGIFSRSELPLESLDDIMKKDDIAPKTRTSMIPEAPFLPEPGPHSTRPPSHSDYGSLPPSAVTVMSQYQGSPIPSHLFGEQASDDSHPSGRRIPVEFHEPMFEDWMQCSSDSGSPNSHNLPSFDPKGPRGCRIDAAPFSQSDWSNMSSSHDVSCEGLERFSKSDETDQSSTSDFSESESAYAYDWAVSLLIKSVDEDLRFRILLQGFTDATASYGSATSGVSSDIGSVKTIANICVPASQLAKTGKRKCPSEDGQDGDRDGGEQKQRPKKRIGSISYPRYLACFFCKHNPVRYAACYNRRHFDKIHRIKQHLRREHRMPIHCPRCLLVFPTNKDRDHHQRTTDCIVVEDATREYEGITEDVMEDLSKRVSSKNTAEENWYLMYSVIFPEDPRPPDPYIPDTISRNLWAMRDFFATRGIDLFAERAKSRGIDIQQCLPDFDQIIDETMIELFERWESAQVANGSTTSVSRAQSSGARSTPPETSSDPRLHFTLSATPPQSTGPEPLGHSLAPSSSIQSVPSDTPPTPNNLCVDNQEKSAFPSETFSLPPDFLWDTDHSIWPANPLLVVDGTQSSREPTMNMPDTVEMTDFTNLGTFECLGPQ